MANYTYTTNTVAEAPFSWENPLHLRYRIDRGVSTYETTPGVYAETRFESYTNELATINAGLNFFRGGYEHVVDDDVRQDLIDSDVATAANFVLIP